MVPRTPFSAWSLLDTPWMTRHVQNPPRRLEIASDPEPYPEPPTTFTGTVETPTSFRAPSDGFVIYDGPSLINGVPIVVIATGFRGTSSKNRKTGAMVQTWILVRDMPPQAALDTGMDEAICGDCPSRGHLAELGAPLPRAYRRRGTGWERGEAVGQAWVAPKGRTCYVAVAKAPNGIWWKFNRGGYPSIGLQELALYCYGRAVRLGTYGDPAAAPPELWEAMVSSARMWTGYTHQWRLPQVQGQRDVLMASVDSEAEAEQAWRMGWRTFRVREHGGAIVAGHEVVCPASDEALEAARPRLEARAAAGDAAAIRKLEQGRVTQCVDCRACQGTQAGMKKSIVIERHGYLDPEQRRRNPWVRDGWVDAGLVVDRPGVGRVWTWELSDWGEVERMKNLRDSLHEAARVWRDTDEAQAGDVVTITIGTEVERLVLVEEGGRLRLRLA